MKAFDSASSFPVLLQEFFCNHLIAQRNLSTQTVASYRDTFRLLLPFTQARIKKVPSKLDLDDIDSPLILAFLDHLVKDRGNLARTRNVRLAAIRSFCHYAAVKEPTFLSNTQRILAIPMKRFDRPLLGFLSRQEIEAIIQAPDKSTRSGHRDQVMFSTFYNTGARISEIIAMTSGDIFLGSSNHVKIHGKGRKERAVPLWKNTAKLIGVWIRRINPNTASRVFSNRLGQPLTRSGIEHRLDMAVCKASDSCPSLKEKNITVHSLRHTTAMHMLQSGIDITTIALWLGHESISTTHLYIEADMLMKQRALEKVTEPSIKSGRFRASDKVLAFLDSL
jgi:site-specific recombinase XerD